MFTICIEDCVWSEITVRIACNVYILTSRVGCEFKFVAAGLLEK